MANTISVEKVYARFSVFFFGTLAFILYGILNPRYTENLSSVLSLTPSGILVAIFLFSYLFLTYVFIKDLIISFVKKYLDDSYKWAYEKYKHHEIMYKINVPFLFVFLAIPFTTYFLMDRSKFVENTAIYEILTVIAWVSILTTYFITQYYQKNKK
jgi:hypothetical protein